MTDDSIWDVPGVPKLRLDQTPRVTIEDDPCPYEGHRDGPHDVRYAIAGLIEGESPGLQLVVKCSCGFAAESKLRGEPAEHTDTDK